MKTVRDFKEPVFKKGERIFIAQINPCTGIESEIYYHSQLWCDSGRQRQFVELGLLFNNRKDAESKCRMLVGLPQLPAPVALVDGVAYMFDCGAQRNVEGIYHAASDAASERFYFTRGRHVLASQCTNIRPLTLAK